MQHDSYKLSSVKLCTYIIVYRGVQKFSCRSRKKKRQLFWTAVQHFPLSRLLENDSRKFNYLGWDVLKKSSTDS